jgi:hypothetical protein
MISQKAVVEEITRCAPNVLPLSCAALIDRNGVCVIPTCKNAPILGPHSGVSYSGVFGRSRPNASNINERFPFTLA